MFQQVPQAPKKPRTAYISYYMDTVEKIREENPEATMSEISAIIGTRWRDLDVEQKDKYLHQYQMDQLGYEKELYYYIKKYGVNNIANNNKNDDLDQNFNDELEWALEIGDKEYQENQLSPLGPFFLFVKDVKEKVVEDNYEADIIELARIFREKWEQLEQEKKQVYSETHSQQVEKQQQQKKEEEKEQEQEQEKSEQLPQPPKRPLSAFFLYKNDVYEQVKQENPNVKLTELTQIIAKMWRELSQIEQDKYEQIYLESKEKYLKEKEEYQEKYGGQSQSKCSIRRQQKQQQNNNEEQVVQPPKRPLAPFFLFSQEVKEEIQKENPEANLTELTKIISGKWKQLDQNQREKYENQFKEAKEKYLKDKQEYEEKQGSCQVGQQKKESQPLFQQSSQPLFQQENQPLFQQSNQLFKQQKDDDDQDQSQQEQQQEQQGQEQQKQGNLSTLFQSSQSSEAQQQGQIWWNNLQEGQQQQQQQQEQEQQKLQQGKAPKPPKRPLASFFLFKQEVYEQVKKENPQAKLTDLIRIISDKWKELDENSKEKYQKLHIQAKERYEVERAEFVKKYGEPQRKKYQFDDNNNIREEGDQKEIVQNDKYLEQENLSQVDQSYNYLMGQQDIIMKLWGVMILLGIIIGFKLAVGIGLFIWIGHTVLRYNLLLPKKNLKGQHVVITGGATGIGKEMAAQMAQYGCKITILDLDYGLGEKTLNEFINKGVDRQNLQVYQCDVSDFENVQDVFQNCERRFGRVDILVNNAGIASGKSICDNSIEAMRKTMEINTTAHLYTTKLVLERMIQRNHGHIITISSCAGLLPSAGLADYNASKYGVVGFHESLTMELNMKKSKVKTTCICPWFIRTRMTENMEDIPGMPVLDLKESVKRMVEGIRQDECYIVIPFRLNIMVYLKYILPFSVVCSLTSKLMSSSLEKVEKNRDKKNN